MKGEIKKYITNEKTGKPITGRCLESHLKKKGYYDYIVNMYNDSESLRESLFRLRNDIDVRPVCKMCGKKVNFLNTLFGQYCSRHCQNNDPDVLEKNKKNVSVALKKAYIERGDEIKEKRAQTLYEQYGEYNITPFGIKEIQEKGKKTFAANRLAGIPANVKGGIISRQRSIVLQESNGYTISYDENNIGYVTVYNGCDICGDITIPTSVFNNRTKEGRIGKLCLTCNPLNNLDSSTETFVKNILDEYNIFYKQNARIFSENKKELDFYIPSKKIAFECNGIFWHSDMRCDDKNYHIYKTNECENLDVSLIHLWENEIIHKPNILKSMILNKLGLTQNKIYARNCHIKEIKNDLYSDFLNNNHIQGHVNSKVKLGLYNNNELVAVMGFGSLRKNMGSKSEENVSELYRFAGKLNTLVIGGASKLFKYFIKYYNPLKIISYARRDYSNGNLYEKLGFDFVRYTVPNYFWINKKGERENRFKYRKSELPKYFDNIDMNKSEVEIMKEQGFLRIWDCGSIKYVYKNKNFIQ